MASTIQVDNIKDIGGNTMISSNGSGTFTSNLPAGVSLTNGVDNRLVTSTSATALNGEARLRYDGDVLWQEASGTTTEFRQTVDGAGTYWSSLIASASDVKLYTRTASPLIFGCNNAEKMRVNNGGGISIGTTETAYGNLLAAGSNGIILTDNSGSIIATDTGNLTLGRTNADDNNRDILNFNRNGSTCGQITGTNSTTTYATSSDYRLKENQIDITDGIDRIKQLKPYKFNFKINPDKTLDGFFAHEVSSIVPEAIRGEKDAMYPEVLYTADDELPEGKNIGDVKEEAKIDAQGIDQSKLIPLLTSALQEAITKIETLETSNTDLTTRLEALENK